MSLSSNHPIFPHAHANSYTHNYFSVINNNDDENDVDSDDDTNMDYGHITVRIRNTLRMEYI